MKIDGKGKRFNKGKNRLDLVPVSLTEEVGKVLTYGATKYDADNWRRGMSWSSVYASMQRHINKWREGDEIDEESGLSHLSHIACNVAFLIEYEKICPEYDDRKFKKEVKHEDI